MMIDTRSKEKKQEDRVREVRNKHRSGTSGSRTNKVEKRPVVAKPALKAKKAAAPKQNSDEDMDSSSDSASESEDAADRQF